MIAIAGHVLDDCAKITEYASRKPTMSSQDHRVLAVVRRQILNGDFAPDDRLSEVAVAEALGVSRTPARTALAALEAEGLIRKRSGRGYCIVPISAEDVRRSIEVRAVLEALAARTLAMNGLTAEDDARLARSIAQTASAVEEGGDNLFAAYQDANVIFHETIMSACGNPMIAHTFERIRRMPLMSLGALAFARASVERERLRLTVGHSQHVIILDAIRKRDAARAEAMMREHSNATLNYADLFAAPGG
ncbi:MAG: GntR family transcriptional regulator of vanillate catabolism [Paracoccaceae bacterium]|jgi:GntR family transcriptional regulator of vanillate catabolism